MSVCRRLLVALVVFVALGIRGLRTRQPEQGSGSLDVSFEPEQKVGAWAWVVRGAACLIAALSLLLAAGGLLSAVLGALPDGDQRATTQRVGDFVFAILILWCAALVLLVTWRGSKLTQQEWHATLATPRALFVVFLVVLAPVLVIGRTDALGGDALPTNVEAAIIGVAVIGALYDLAKGGSVAALRVIRDPDSRARHNNPRT